MKIKELKYFNLSTSSCSGYRPQLHYLINDMYNKNKSLFKFAHQIKNYLFTHAGLTEYVWKKYTEEVNKLPIDKFCGNYADWLNLSLESSNLLGVLKKVGKRRGGWDFTGGIFWCDKGELLKDHLEANIIQVVGHTPVAKLRIEKGFKGEELIHFTDIYSHIIAPIILEI